MPHGEWSEDDHAACLACDMYLGLGTPDGDSLAVRYFDVVTLSAEFDGLSNAKSIRVRFGSRLSCTYKLP